MNGKIANSIEFREALPGKKEYFNLFETTGWNKGYQFTADDLSQAIKNSWYVLSLHDADRLIGFGRLISDGVHHALVVDLIIHPDYQGKGLGSELLERLVKKCRHHRIRDVQLFSARDKFAFYERFGFEKRPVNAPGMQLRKGGDI
jgi:GNAT superfamily N-acetyltransferase